MHRLDHRQLHLVLRQGSIERLPSTTTDHFELDELPVPDPRLPRAQLLAVIRAAAENGADWIQVRDHRASARELFDLHANFALH